MPKKTFSLYVVEFDMPDLDDLPTKVNLTGVYCLEENVEDVGSHIASYAERCKDRATFLVVESTRD